MALKVKKDEGIEAFARVAARERNFRSYWSPSANHGQGGIIFGRAAFNRQNAFKKTTHPDIHWEEERVAGRRDYVEIDGIDEAVNTYGFGDYGFETGKKGGTRGGALVRYPDGRIGTISLRSALIARSWSSWNTKNKRWENSKGQPAMLIVAAFPSIIATKAALAVMTKKKLASAIKRAEKKEEAP